MPVNTIKSVLTDCIYNSFTDIYKALMGQKQTISNERKDIKPVKILIQKNHFEMKYIIGRGGFGKVWKVQLKSVHFIENKKKVRDYPKTSSEEEYALKIMSKAKIIDKRSEHGIIYEFSILSRINHPFLVNLHFAFHDSENIYLVLDLLSGGDLRYHLNKNRKFNEKQTSKSLNLEFFTCCIILALEFLHSNKIIHRDLKPENLVLDNRGYVHLTDFGVAKRLDKDNSSETSGTPGYMAPEVICALNHGLSVDYFALGVIVYECMIGSV